MISVTISGRIPQGVSEADLKRALRLTFAAARRRPAGSVTLAFVSDAKMQQLNRRRRNKSRTTDVLSFAPAESVTPRNEPKPWGDLIVSPSFVERSAKQQQVEFREELLRVTVHGMLHLFGFDHATKKEEQRMFGLQERVVRAFS